MNLIPALIFFMLMSVVSVAFGAVIGYTIALNTMKHLIVKYRVKLPHD